jgi:two-component system NarL family sensor kinase
MLCILSSFLLINNKFNKINFAGSNVDVSKWLPFHRNRDIYCLPENPLKRGNFSNCLNMLFRMSTFTNDTAYLKFNMKQYLIFCAPFFFVFVHSYAQNIPDSLLNKLSHATNDSIKARTLLDIGEAIEETSPGISLQYYQQALEVSKKNKNKKLMLSSVVDIGISYIQSNELDKALSSFTDAIPVAKEINDTGKIAAVMANIGNVYLHKKNPVKAIEFYLQSARLLEQCSNQERLPALYANLCSLLDDQNESDQSIQFGNKAFELAQKNNDEYSAAHALLNLSVTYGHLNQSEKQFKILQEALPIVKKNGDLELLGTVYNNLGAYYYEKNEYQDALNNYLQSYTYSQQMGNHYHLCTSCSHLALIYHQLNMPDKALQFIMQAETLAKEVGSRADLKEIYYTRAEIEKERGNFKKAYDYLSQSASISDSLFKVESSEKIADMEEKYETEKKEKSIIQLTKDKQIQALSIKEKSTLNYFLIASLGVLLIAAFVGFRNFRHRQLLAKQQGELQQQHIRELEKDKQLVAVDSMLKGQEDERTRLAKDLHDGLGGMLSGVKFSLMNMKSNLIINHENVIAFERSLDMLDTSIQELRRVAHNMMPEALVKFGLDEALKDYCNNINTAQVLNVKYQSFGMENRMESTTEIIVYRIIQELLNNIFKHARASEVLVQLIREEDRISIAVEDNGKGFDVKILEKSKSSGWANILSRVNYLRGKLDIISGDNKGTSVNIEVYV